MEVSIATPLGFSELGQRTNNEDSIFPDPASVTSQQRWFMVCDGVGGAQHGEIASRLAVTALDEFFSRRPGEVATEAFVQEGIALVEDRFNSYLADNSKASDMGTTLTLLFLHQAGATVAHIGDSRVYQIRDGRIEWRTDDHSYVNELVKGGVISAEEAPQHPQRNVITRAIQGGNTRVKASIQVINDLRPGDYFFLCSDGVLERVSDELLEKITGGTESNEEKITAIFNCCYGHTRDNFSAYLIQVELVSGGVAPIFRVEKPFYERPETQADDAITLISSPLPMPQEAPVAKPSALVLTPPQYMPSPKAKTAVRPKPHGRRSPKRHPWAAFGIVLSLVAVVTLAWNRYTNPSHSSKVLTTKLSRVVAQNKTDSILSVTKTSHNKTEKVQAVPKVAVPERISAGRAVKEAVVNQQDNAMEVREKLSSVTYLGRSRSGMFGLVRKDKRNWIIKPQFESISSFDRGIAQAVRNGEVKYLTEDGHIYDEKGEINCNRILVRQGTRYGFLNLNGQLAIALRYAAATSFNADCTAQVTADGKSFRIDPKGNVMSE